MTGFAEGEAFKIGEQAFARIARLCYYLDKLMSKMSKATAANRYRMRKAANRIRWKLKDLTVELHWKTTCFLQTSWTVFSLIAKTSQMSRMMARVSSSL
jgi:putative transposase